MTGNSVSFVVREAIWRSITHFMVRQTGSLQINMALLFISAGTATEPCMTEVSTIRNYSSLHRDNGKRTTDPEMSFGRYLERVGYEQV